MPLVSSGQPEVWQPRLGYLGIDRVLPWVEQGPKKPEPGSFLGPYEVSYFSTAYRFSRDFVKSHPQYPTQFDGSEHRPWSRAVEGGSEATQCPVLLVVSAGAFDVEVVADLLDGFLTATFAQEVRLEHEPFVIREDCPGWEEPV